MHDHSQYNEMNVMRSETKFPVLSEKKNKNMRDAIKSNSFEDITRGSQQVFFGIIVKRTPTSVMRFRGLLSTAVAYKRHKCIIMSQYNKMNVMRSRMRVPILYK